MCSLFPLLLFLDTTQGDITRHGSTLHYFINHPCTLVHGRGLGTTSNNKGETSMSISMQQWATDLAREAIERGDHIPHTWQVIFDDGMDGCVSKGFYARGIKENGTLCDFPIMHEYGAFDSEKEAWDHVESVKEKLA